eukprot:jgi/Astpho2/6419/Aster-x0280
MTSSRPAASCLGTSQSSHSLETPGMQRSACPEVHFTSYPASTLLAWSGLQSSLDAYLNSLKEAAVIARGNAAAVMNMSDGAQKDLWRSIQQSDLPAFERVAASLQVEPAGRGSRQACLPLRVYAQTRSEAL